MASISGPDSSSAANRLTLEAFERAAGTGDENATIEVNGERLEVLAQGRMPGSGRGVAWVASGSETGIARAFSEALAERFGGAIADKVSQELGLGALSGKRIESRLVRQAIDMAQTASTALEGSQFAATLTHGAVVNSPTFLAVAGKLGLASESVGAARRAAIDAAFAGLLAREQTPPDVDTCTRLLEQAMRDVLSRDASDS